MEEELEILESIYLGDDLVINREEDKAEVSLRCYPRGDDQMFVSATILFQLTINYPEISPIISLPDSSGIDEKDRIIVLGELNKILIELKGESVCFSIIESLSDQLDQLNNESRCHICLSPLLQTHEEDNNRKIKTVSTKCKHNYHCYCLSYWWHECIISKHMIEIRKGGEDISIGKKREAIAKQNILENNLISASNEVDKAKNAVEELQQQLNQLTLSKNTNSSSKSKNTTKKLSRSEMNSLEEAENELKTILNNALQRQTNSINSFNIISDRVKKGKLELQNANKCAEEAMIQNDIKLLSEIPCPVCRSILNIKDTPFNNKKFMNDAKKKLSLLEETTTETPPPPPPP
mmetsp:Transcript_22878/g.26902  ORF Transcript_22878/g.26902 Transcript_22878/m.26902 type:complete len:350 (-) Transcript_22878:32-1081(-)